MESFNDNDRAELAWQFVENTDRNIFLTGKAGTGKTYFLHKLRESSKKKMVVTAPTGVAAINAKGVTLHSFFQLSFGPLVPEATRENDYSHKFSKNKIRLIKSLDLLVIDEISMVRADILDGVDLVLRRFRRHDKPFGGLQLLMIGDLEQLPPVVTNNERDLIAAHYKSPYFFESIALNKISFISIELEHVYRQQNSQFIEILNAVRKNQVTNEILSALNTRCSNSGVLPKDAITLCTLNASADKINTDRLDEIKEKPITFRAIINGDFGPSLFPVDEELTLKKGAHVMFCKNDANHHKFYNGKIGEIIDLSKENIVVRCFDDNTEVDVPIMEWENMRYNIDDKGNVHEEKIGSFKQLPLKLAWGITIHKSQGLTFDKVIIDGRRAFAHGQIYVALSRCRTLDGIYLPFPISNSLIVADENINNFTANIECNIPDETALDRAKVEYAKKTLEDVFDFSYAELFYRKSESTFSQHKGAYPQSLVNKIIESHDKFRKEILIVADKFKVFIENIVAKEQNIEKCDKLQERIKGGSKYFSDKIKEILIPIIEQSYKVDNKEANKRMLDAYEQFAEGLMQQTGLIDECKDGFILSHVMGIRAKTLANIESGVKQIHKPVSVESKLSTALKQWREEKASNLNISTNKILQEKELQRLITTIPHTVQNLKGLVAVTRIKTFGTEIINVINQTTGEGQIIPVNTELQDFFGLESPEVTLKMIEAGKTIDEIAKARNLKRSTIEGHIIEHVKKGNLNLTDYISAKEIEVVKTLVNHGLKSRTDIINHSSLIKSYFKAELGLIAIAKGI